jgi:hypothetical protein
MRNRRRGRHRMVVLDTTLCDTFGCR